LRLGGGRSSSCCNSSRRSCGAEAGGIGSRARFGTPPPPLPQPTTLLGRRPAGSRGQCLMGVAGLTGYINKNLRGAVAMEDLREGDTLAIDGSGWMFHLLEGQRVDHGGDYDLLHKTVVRKVGRLRQ
ncbi:unnamed protein product, partial [Ectocarpus sp. 13 AM-2016]